MLSLQNFFNGAHQWAPLLPLVPNFQRSLVPTINPSPPEKSWDSNESSSPTSWNWRNNYKIIIKCCLISHSFFEINSIQFTVWLIVGQFVRWIWRDGDFIRGGAIDRESDGRGMSRKYSSGLEISVLGIRCIYTQASKLCHVYEPILFLLLLPLLRLYRIPIIVRMEDKDRS